MVAVVRGHCAAFCTGMPSMPVKMSVPETCVIDGDGDGDASRTPMCRDVQAAYHERAAWCGEP